VLEVHPGVGRARRAKLQPQVGEALLRLAPVVDEETVERFGEATASVPSVVGCPAAGRCPCRQTRAPRIEPSGSVAGDPEQSRHVLVNDRQV
jgi:hypothetical protein